MSDVRGVNIATNRGQLLSRQRKFFIVSALPKIAVRVGVKTYGVTISDWEIFGQSDQWLPNSRVIVRFQKGIKFSEQGYYRLLLFPSPT